MSGSDTIISAFSEEQASRLTGISVGRLRRWQKTDFFTPSFKYDPDERFGRLYSFKDVVCLRTISILINDYKIPLSRLRDTFERLFEMDQSKWASKKIYVLGKTVYHKKGDIILDTTGQMPLHNIELHEIASETKIAIDRAKQRPADSIGKIEKARGICGNRPIISGTRITAETIVDYHKGGASFEDIIREYPRIERADIVAALEYFGINAA